MVDLVKATSRAQPRARVRRNARRASYDRELIAAICDEALICHVGFAVDGQPVVLPTIHARVGDCLYLHGAPANRMLKTLVAGVPACVTVTLIDGLVLARSAFHHSLNYRSAVLFGRAQAVTDRAEVRRALDALVEHVRPGRSAEARPPTDAELTATRVVRFEVEDASAKQRAGPPIDDASDLDWPCWAGVIPLAVAHGDPEPVAASTGERDAAPDWPTR